MTEYRHEIPMRWADLDSLNHVNNVVYLEYAADARVAMDAALPEGVPVRSVIEFRRPILLGRAPVVVTSTVEGSVVRQSIGVAGSDREFAHVEVTYGHPADVEPMAAAHTHELALRETDFSDGRVSEAQVFELFQECRIPYIATLLPQMAPGRFVVARVEVDHLRPITRAAQALITRERVAHVGTSSYSIASQLLDDDVVVASSTSVLVGFDLPTQSARRLTDDELGYLEAGLAAVSSAS